MTDNTNLDLEKFIGKPIEEASKLGKIVKRPDNYYSFEPNPIIGFFDCPCGNLLISANTNKIIESISIPFPNILDKSFYSEFINFYGVPNSILALDKLLSESKRKELYGGEFQQTVAKREYSMKEVDFEDKPLFILWKKENYQIKMTFYYEHKGTQLTFRKPTDTF